MIETEAKRPRVLLAAVDTGEYDAEQSLDELEELADTAGADTAARIVQKRPAFDSATCIGPGRLEEMAQLCQSGDIDQIIFDHELTATQIRNIEDACGVHTIDRTMLILDIFAQRATTHEGRLQVELAQQRYRLPRLAGMGIQLSRLGGGIGTRGPGETKLETDKRHIRTRISNLSAELKEIEKRRTYARSRRKKDGVLVCAIVGYTNVGKSTLLNLLTDAGVLAENKLFATLETTSRAIELPDGRSLMLVDTVGLIRRLPHHLVEAFKSTLEEAANADVILHICDASAENCEEQAQVTLDLLSELGCDGIPVVTVFNKCDLLPEELAFAPETRNAVLISAKENRGMDQLLAALAKALPDPARRMRLLLPFSQGSLLNEIRSSGKLFSEEYTPDGVLVDAMVDVRLQKAAAPYETEKA
ncbi:GTPase HflX [Ruminococcus champanellensis]|uniref:GTPase HflX n=1 Tax=Ruminococcus champanellensis (strain DSM 18848 / JCM 17042 / KCTC 15320 / 18P13) TaxID=213810 RepID=D4LFG5_RUMC1|nr:GTPase HflX [Ruminococcus champanellensis]CBL18360.1 GTP-binding protein HflX [Ruminococcus champanellensis 18P13 = JCM 17042]